MALGNSKAYTVTYIPRGIDRQLTGLDSRMAPSNAGGVFSKQYGVELVKNNIIDLLSTKKGDRVMLPEFGTNIHLAVFEELDFYLKRDIENEIYRAIATYEPRVDVKSLEITVDNEKDTFTLSDLDNVGTIEESKIFVALTVSLKDDATATEFINLAF